MYVLIRSNISKSAGLASSEKTTGSESATLTLALFHGFASKVAVFASVKEEGLMLRITLSVWLIEPPQISAVVPLAIWVAVGMVVCSIIISVTALR